jgi:hypothetical protein
LCIESILYIESSRKITKYNNKARYITRENMLQYQQLEISPQNCGQICRQVYRYLMWLNAKCKVLPLIAVTGRRFDNLLPGMHSGNEEERSVLFSS